MFKKVLYPVDVQEGELSRKSLAEVLDLVRHWGASLHVMYVLPGFGMPLVASYFPEDALEKIRDDAAEHLDAYIRDNVPDDIRTTPVVAEGTVYEEILREAEALEVDVIIIPSHDRGAAQRWLLGSNAAKVVQHAHCAVLVLRSP